VPAALSKLRAKRSVAIGSLLNGPVLVQGATKQPLAQFTVILLLELLITMRGSVWSSASSLSQVPL
jgi:hypothetical protein